MPGVEGSLAKDPERRDGICGVKSQGIRLAQTENTGGDERIPGLERKLAVKVWKGQPEVLMLDSGGNREPQTLQEGDSRGVEDGPGRRHGGGQRQAMLVSAWKAPYEPGNVRSVSMMAV